MVNGVNQLMWMSVLVLHVVVQLLRIFNRHERSLWMLNFSSISWRCRWIRSTRQWCSFARSCPATRCNRWSAESWWFLSICHISFRIIYQVCYTLMNGFINWPLTF